MSQLQAKTILKIDSLYKKYSKKGSFAVDDLSLEIKEGEVVGILGHNGAGKSTTLKCITGMLMPTMGNIYINGISLKKNPIEAKKNFSFVTDDHNVFLKMTGLQYLNFMADVYKVDTPTRKQTYETLEKCFNLGDSIHNLIGSYSLGMKQKICMMGSLMHSPSLWILDEPLTGLDPQICNTVIDFMKDYANSGKTIIFSSHNLDAVKKLCNRVIGIKEGKLVKDVYIKDAEGNLLFDIDEIYKSISE